MNVKLTKIKSNHSNLRTDEIVGESIGLPLVGVDFVMTSESLTPGGFMRLIQTTIVTDVTKLSDKKYEFTTSNSTYQVEVLK